MFHSRLLAIAIIVGMASAQNEAASGADGGSGESGSGTVETLDDYCKRVDTITLDSKCETDASFMAFYDYKNCAEAKTAAANLMDITTCTTYKPLAKTLCDAYDSCDSSAFPTAAIVVLVILGVLVLIAIVFVIMKFSTQSRSTA